MNQQFLLNFTQHFPGSYTPDDPTPLNYASQQRDHSWWNLLLQLRILAWLIVAILAIAIPVPEGICYFGPRSQWLIAVESAGLTLGTSNSPTSYGWLPLIALKLLLLATPLWLLRRWYIRHDSQ